MPNQLLQQLKTTFTSTFRSEVHVTHLIRVKSLLLTDISTLMHWVKQSVMLTPPEMTSKCIENKLILGHNLEKAHAGSGAEYKGISTRNGDLLTLFFKNIGVASGSTPNKALVVNHFFQVMRISAQGCDVLD